MPPNSSWASLSSAEAGHNIEKVLDGDLDPIVEAFRKAQGANR